MPDPGQIQNLRLIAGIDMEQKTSKAIREKMAGRPLANGH